MRTLLPFGSLLLCLVATSSLAVEPEYEVFQPVENRSNLVLRSARGQARVEKQGGATQRVSLRSDELLSTIAETRGGWIAAGIAEKEDASRLVVIRRSAQGTQRLSPPGRQRHPIRARPTLAVHRQELAGMAWLEGPDPTSFSVRVAASDPDSGWTDVSIVAPPARGSQTGLVATVLESGEWLLAWSAFDGKDDEILWSVGSQDNWTAPRRLDRNNSVPDIMPAIVTTRGGALLTWSRRIEGEYRVMSARFNGSSWSRIRPIGPPGSLEPGFAYQDGRLLLLYRHAWPQAWAVAEMGSDGQTRSLAVSTQGSESRPVLSSSAANRVALRWADQRRAVLGLETLP